MEVQKVTIEVHEESVYVHSDNVSENEIGKWVT